MNKIWLIKRIKAPKNIPIKSALRSEIFNNKRHEMIEILKKKVDNEAIKKLSFEWRYAVVIPTKAETGTDQITNEKYLFAVNKLLSSSPGANTKTKLRENISKMKQIKDKDTTRKNDDFIKKFIFTLNISIFWNSGIKTADRAPPAINPTRKSGIVNKIVAISDSEEIPNLDAIIISLKKPKILPSNKPNVTTKLLKKISLLSLKKKPILDKNN